MDNILFSLERILGSSKKTSSSERLFFCPFCYHHKPKLSINFGERAGYWKCWVCDVRGRKISSLLYKLGYSGKEIGEILGDYEPKFVQIKEETSSDIRLPREYRPLWKVNNDSYEYKNALRYVMSRKMGPIDIYRYLIGYCEDGKYKNRIIIPSFDKNFKLNYFVARKYYDGGMSYMLPAASKNTIIFENLISWKYPIVLVEGVFDAIAVRKNAIPLLGKTMSNKLKSAILTKKPPAVYVMLDRDARRNAIEIENYLKSFDINVKLVSPNKKDPSDLGFTGSWKNIKSAKSSTFVDLVETKL